MSNRFFRFALFIITFYFLFAGLYHGKVFFVPIAVAAILSMLLVPITKMIEKRGINRAMASGLSVLIIVISLTGLTALLMAQVRSLSEDLPAMQENAQKLLENTKGWIAGKTNLSENKISEYFKTASEKVTSALGGHAGSFISSFFSTATDLLLIMIYVYCFLYYRDKLYQFVLKVIPDKNDKAEEVIKNTSKVARQYLAGRLLLILFLAIFYSIGFSILGLKHALFMSIFAAVFSIIPYIGNVIGITFPIIMTLVSSGSMSDLIGVLIVFSVVQFIESYILEPVVVGGRVDLNPFFVIVSVVLGGILWGVAGLIVAIPIVGILKVLFENIPSLHPYGYLIAETESGGIEEKIGRKIKDLWKRIKG